MSFGGFLGIGEDYYPLPWSLLTYNPRLEGYEVNVGEQQLKGAPKYSKHESWDWSDRTRDKQVYDYYGVGPYWPKPGQETDGGHCEPPATAGGFFMHPQGGPPGCPPTSLEFGFICYISRVSLGRLVDTRADLYCRRSSRGGKGT
jgi:hypothetical protein